MPILADDELDQAAETTAGAGDKASVVPKGRSEKAVKPPAVTDQSHLGEADIGVIVSAGTGQEPSTVSGYFVTLDDQGRFVNDTGIPTERLLDAARASGLPIYIKQGDQLFRGRLEPSGHSVVALNPIIPSGDIARSLNLPTNEQHRLIDRHLENQEVVEHLINQPSTSTAPSSPTSSARPAAPNSFSPVATPP